MSEESIMHEHEEGPSEMQMLATQPSPEAEQKLRIRLELFKADLIRNSNENYAPRFALLPAFGWLSLAAILFIALLIPAGRQFIRHPPAGAEILSASPPVSTATLPVGNVLSSTLERLVLSQGAETTRPRLRDRPTTQPVACREFDKSEHYPALASVNLIRIPGG